MPQVLSSFFDGGNRKNWKNFFGELSGAMGIVTLDASLAAPAGSPASRPLTPSPPHKDISWPRNLIIHLKSGQKRLPRTRKRKKKYSASWRKKQPPPATASNSPRKNDPGLHGGMFLDECPPEDAKSASALEPRGPADSLKPSGRIRTRTGQAFTHNPRAPPSPPVGFAPAPGRPLRTTRRPRSSFFSGASNPLVRISLFGSSDQERRPQAPHTPFAPPHDPPCPAMPFSMSSPQHSYKAQ